MELALLYLLYKQNMWKTSAVQSVAGKRIQQEICVQQVSEGSGGKFSCFLDAESRDFSTAKGAFRSAVIVNQ